jgi:hypothetical protein
MTPLILTTLALVAVGPGEGLASRHPGDVGLGEDPAVLLVDTFDAGALGEVLARWDESSNEGGAVLSLSDDVPSPAKGGRSLRVEAHPGRDTGGHLYTRLPRGVDELYLRFYVKFPEPAGYVHHFVHLGGYRPATSWPQGGAGDRPEGDERVTVGIEPFGRDGSVPPPGDWNFYAYWHEMKGSADGRYWGNGLSPAVPARVPAGRWQCVEVRMKLNAPGRRDGALALWLDGEPVMAIEEGTKRGPWTGLGFVLDPAGEPFEGFDFRTTDGLKINFVWLLHYVTEASQRRNGAEGRPVVVLFDQVVAATEYIGPMSPGR